ncbi:hypothetical protein Droror1_Dr00011702 [Drosera rotundifolia]
MSSMKGTHMTMYVSRVTSTLWRLVLLIPTSSQADFEDVFDLKSEPMIELEEGLFFLALSGLSSPNTKRIQGKAGKVALEILIDSTSMSSFKNESMMDVFIVLEKFQLL